MYYAQNESVDTEESTRQIHSIEPSIRVMQNVHTPPAPQIRPRPSPTGITGEEAAEDWDAEVVSLFEWAGMASLGSQR